MPDEHETMPQIQSGLLTISERLHRLRRSIEDLRMLEACPSEKGCSVCQQRVEEVLQDFGRLQSLGCPPAATHPALMGVRLALSKAVAGLRETVGAGDRNTCAAALSLAQSRLEQSLQILQRLEVSPEGALRCSAETASDAADPEIGATIPGAAGRYASTLGTLASLMECAVSQCPSGAAVGARADSFLQMYDEIRGLVLLEFYSLGPEDSSATEDSEHLARATLDLAASMLGPSREAPPSVLLARLVEVRRQVSDSLSALCAAG